MGSSRIGTSLRSARERAGWSREALAYRSGMSWAAIAQIESGRRREVRLGSLLALATALDISVDYLAGGDATVSPRLLEHGALIYGSDAEYLASLVPFLTDGISRGECVIAVTSRSQIDLLREALGNEARHVEFRDSSAVYETPVTTLNGYRDFLEETFAAGAPWIRVIGEPVWEGRSEAEVIGWTRYESMVNVALASAPATIVCPYDARSLPEEILARARHTHPELAEGGVSAANPDYREAEGYLLAVS